MTFIQSLLIITGAAITVITLAFVYVVISNYRYWNRYAASEGAKIATVTWKLFKRIYELNPSAYDVNSQ